MERLEDRRLLAINFTGIPTWVEQGPRPIVSDPNEINTIAAPGNAAGGAIETVAIRAIPNSSLFQIYAATVNGGVWRTDNADPANPGDITWTPLTDQLGSLGMGSIAYSPVDATGNMLFATTGSFSNLGGSGGPAIGVLRTTDGGATWNTFPLTAGPGEPQGKTVLPTSIDLDPGAGVQQMILVGTLGGGLRRSDDSGQTWAGISGTNGLLNGNVTQLIGDPTNVNVFYAAVSQQGIFRGTFDTGTGIINWTPLTTGLTNFNTSTDIQVTADDAGGNTVLFALVVGNVPGNQGAFRLDTTGGNTTWTALAQPPAIFANPNDGSFFPGPSQSGFFIAADPTDSQVAYITGYSSGDHVFRYDPTGGGNWQVIMAGGGGPTRPHPDGRSLVFLDNNTLVEVDDGGIYFLPNPSTATAATNNWQSFNGNTANGTGVGAVELHNIAWDSRFDVIVSGSQDNGSEVQQSTGDRVWTAFNGGDGGDVAIDVVTLAGASRTIRYVSTQNMGGLRRVVFDSATNIVQNVPILPGGGLTNFTGTFVPHFEVNAVGPAAGQSKSLVVGGGGTSPVYEATMPMTVNSNADVTWTAVPVPGGFGTVNTLAYGGRRNAADDANVLYAGTQNGVFVRTTAGGTLNATGTAFPGGTVSDIDLDPADWTHAFVTDSSGNVFETPDMGETWIQIGSSIATNTQTIEFVENGAIDAILVGALEGVYRMITNLPGVWTEFGLNLPNANVWDLDYSVADDLLVAGTLGRGAWTVDNLASVVVTPPTLNVCGDEQYPNQDDTFLLVRDPNNPLLLQVFINNVLEFSGPLAALQQINVFGVGGNDELIIDTTNGLITVPLGIRYDGDGACFEFFVQDGEGFDTNTFYGFDRGFDTLTITSDDTDTAFDSEEIAIGQLPGSGRHTIQDSTGVQTVWFEELEPVTTNVNAAAFAITSIPGLASLLQDANTVTYEAAQILAAPAGRVTVDNFEPIEFANKTAVTIDLGSGDDHFVGNHGGLPTGLETITVNGDAGDDSIAFETIPDASSTSFVSVTINGGVGDDVLDAGEITVQTPFLLRGDGGEDLLIGGRGNDQLNGGDDDDTLIGGDPTKGSALIGNNVYRGGTGFDTIVILGTKSNDTADVTQSSATALTSVVNGNTSTESLPNADVEQVRIEPGQGNDVIRITIDDALFGAGANPDDDVLRFHVIGGSPNASDLLNVVDDGLGDTVIQYVGNDDRSGSVSIAPGHPNGAAPPIVYEGIEHVFVTPIDAITGGTGTDGEGRLVVFKHDPWESNNTLPTATFLGAGATLNVDPTIAPGAGPLGIPGDQDFFQFVAAQTGTLDYQVYFETVGALANGRTGLPGDGSLAIEVRDSDGTLIGSGTNLTDPAGNVIGRRFTHPAVRNQTYYLRVQGATATAVNVYNFTVLNVPAPVPDIVDLQAASDSGRNDTDDVTRVTTPTFDIVLDDDRLDEFTNLNLLPDTTDDDTPDAAAHYGVQLFNNGVAIGYAFYTGSGNTWRFTAGAGDLLEGHNNFLSAAVWVRDRANPEQLGRGEWGPALQVTLDTIAPPVSILGIHPAAADTGVAGYPATFADRITRDTATGFVGRAEADAIVRLYVDAASNNGINNPAEYSLTVAWPYDGDEAFPASQWAASFIRGLNDPNAPSAFPFDGLREVLVTAEDFNSLFGETGTQDEIATAVDFDGGGIRLGLDGERHHGCHGFLLYGKSAMSLVAGEFSAAYFQGTDQDQEIVNTAWKAGRLVPILDLELGAGWQSPCGRFRVTGGYVINMWFNTLTTDSWIRSVQQNNFVGQADAVSYDTLTFDGFTARTEYRF